MRPWEIARLTDHQIIHSYILPAAMRAEELKKASSGAPLPAPPDDDETERPPPNRNMMLSVMMSMLGMTKEQAIAEYESQAKLNAEKKRKRG